MKPPEVKYFILEQYSTYISGREILDFRVKEVDQSEVGELLENRIRVHKRTTSFEVLTSL